MLQGGKGLTGRRVIARGVLHDHIGWQPRGKVHMLPLHWQVALAQRVQSRKLPQEYCTFHHSSNVMHVPPKAYLLPFLLASAVIMYI